jgi:hypothetical protein
MILRTVPSTSALLEGVRSLPGGLGPLGLQDLAPAQDDVALAAPVDALHLALELLAHEDREVLHVVEIDLARGHERAVPGDLELEPALVHARDAGLDDLARAEHLPVGLLDAPGQHADVEALARLVALDHDLELVARVRAGSPRSPSPSS